MHVGYEKIAPAIFSYPTCIPLCLTALRDFCYNLRALTQSDNLVGIFVIMPVSRGRPSGEEDYYMPNNAAAEKRMRQEQKRRTHNRSVKSLVKTQVTKARVAITSASMDQATAEVAVRAAVSELDRAAKKGVLHKNNAARRKSRLMKQLNAK